jgi:hypothetical protein
MKLIKGETLGAIKLDVSGDERINHIFDGVDPELVEARLTLSYNQMITGHYRIARSELECEFRTPQSPLYTGVTTHHKLTEAQLSAILDILAQTEADATDVDHALFA